jgi:type IV pilus assembly protein PilQ
MEENMVATSAKPTVRPLICILATLAIIGTAAIQTTTAHAASMAAPAWRTTIAAAAQQAAEQAEAEQPTGPQGYPLVSNVFFDTDLRQAISDVASQTGATIMPDESVSGYVTLELNDVPLEEALDLLLMPGGYVYGEVKEGVYLVTSPDPLAPAFQKIAQTQSFSLEYVDSNELAALLPDAYARFVKPDQLGNRIVVSAPPRLLEETYEVIMQLDQPPIQVMIEALVVEADRSKLREFELSLQGDHVGVSPGTGLITYVDQAQRLLHQLQWLASKQHASIRANPRIVSQEGLPAQVKVAREQYFEILTGRAGYEYVRLEEIEAAISLNITPRVAENNREVTCIIEPEVGDVTGMGANNLPIITRRTAQSTIRVPDGEVIAIGGLLEEVEQRIESRIPVLSEIPLIGDLFESTDKRTSQREIIIFIAPHILQDGRFEGQLLLDRAEDFEADPEVPRR